jgi:hypothetical protein
MFNLARQVRAATDHAANAAGRLAGKELLKFANDETTIAQLKDRIAKTIDYLKNIKQSEIDGTESKEISINFPSGQTRQFTGYWETACQTSTFTRREQPSKFEFRECAGSRCALGDHNCRRRAWEPR